MWKSLKIKDECFIFKCDISESENFKYFLTNLKESWYEDGSINDILKRAKELNRRIEYDRDTILQKIQEIPPQYNFDCEFTNSSSSKEEINFSLEYSVSNRPFNFNWRLKKCLNDELLNLIIRPLIVSVGCLLEQNQELKTIIEKKDAEIEQYKQEGAVLRRSKIATEPFCEDAFEEKYAINDISDIMELANANEDTFKMICGNVKLVNKHQANKEAIAGGSSSSLQTKTNYQRSPRGKNKFHKLQLLQTKRKNNNKETKINYESSDSCTPPMDLNEIKLSINGFQEQLIQQESQICSSGKRNDSESINNNIQDDDTKQKPNSDESKAKRSKVLKRKLKL